MPVNYSSFLPSGETDWCRELPVLEDRNAGGRINRARWNVRLGIFPGLFDELLQGPAMQEAWKTAEKLVN